MAYKEYRGGGKSGHDIGTMATIWDAEWDHAATTATVDHLAQTEHWPWIQQFLPPPRRVLEGGCGLGRWVRFLDEHGYEGHGVDFSAVGVAGARARWPGLRVLVADLRTMPYEDGFFGGIISFGAIEHDINGPAANLAEMRRVLAADGVLYCTVPCMNWVRRAGFMALQNWIVCNRTIRRWTGRPPEVAFYEYLFTPTEYEKILKQAGFEVIKMVPLAPQEFWMGRVGSIRWRVLNAIHRWCPWLMPHMMAAICRKA
jgi:SAM-dependent methyltransferase